jgi:hypothetical protein
MSKTQHGRELTGEEMAQMLGEFVNRFGGEPEAKAFVSYLTTREHRTIQQNIMGLFVAAIEAWAAQTSFDGRNEATVKLAKKIIAATGDKYDRALPFI